MKKNDSKFCEDFTRYSHVMKDIEKCINQCEKCKELETKTNTPLHDDEWDMGIPKDIDWEFKNNL